MTTVLTGENSFALRSELKVRINAFVAAHGDIAVERLDGQEASVDRIRASLQSAPFLAERKLVILQSPGANKQFAEQVETLLGDVADTTDVIVVEPKLDKRSTYYKFLKKATTLQEFGELDDRSLARWLAQDAKGQGGILSLADAAYLVERVGLSQQMATQELNKLLVYNPTITRQTIDLLVESTPQSTIFELLDAAFSGNTRRALALYRDQREQKVDPARIIALMTWQLRMIALLVTGGQRSVQDIAREAGVSPYTLQKSVAVAKRLNVAKLKSLVADLLALDVRSKRESIDLSEALQNYLLQLAD